MKREKRVIFSTLTICLFCLGVLFTSFLTISAAERWCENIIDCGNQGGCAADMIVQKGCKLTCRSKLGNWIYKEEVDCGPAGGGDPLCPWCPIWF